MRCRAGDLALIVPPAMKENCGKMVRCLRLVSDAGEFGRFLADIGPVWEVDRDVTWVNTGGFTWQIPYCTDRALVPIRPGDDRQDATPEKVDYEVSA